MKGHKTLGGPIDVFLSILSDFIDLLFLYSRSQVYKVEITHDISTWIIYRRYSQFYALLEEVRLWCVCVCISLIFILTEAWPLVWHA